MIIGCRLVAGSLRIHEFKLLTYFGISVQTQFTKLQNFLNWKFIMLEPPWWALCPLQSYSCSFLLAWCLRSASLPPRCIRTGIFSDWGPRTKGNTVYYILSEAGCLSKHSAAGMPAACSFSNCRFGLTLEWIGTQVRKCRRKRSCDLLIGIMKTV